MMHLKLTAALLAGASAPALGAFQLTENFTNDTDAYWEGVGNRVGGQNYGWSDSDNTGIALAPPGGVATGGGELGGSFLRTATPAYYGFDTGTMATNSPLSASGVYRYASGGGGVLFGWFNNTTTQASSEARNFIGVFLDDGFKTYVVGANNTGQDREPAFPSPIPSFAPGTNHAWSISYDPAAGGGQGAVTVVFDGNSFTNILNNVNIHSALALNRFGVFQVGAAGSVVDAYWDDITFTSNNPFPPPPSGSVWKVNNDGDWFVGSNWTGGIPNASGAEATFGTAITSGKVVFTNAPVTLGTAHFTSLHSYLLDGLGTLTLQVPSAAALVDVQRGAHKINLPLTVASDAELQVAGGATLRIADPITLNSNVDLTKSGTGAVIYESFVTLQSGATITFDSSQHVASLSIGSNAKATLLAHGGRLLQADSLSISLVGAKLDLKDNKMLFKGQAPGGFSGGSYMGVTGFVDRGRGNAGNALWDGPGIVTSDTRAINNGDLVSIGVAQVSDVRGIAATATTTFAGQTVMGSDTIAMATWGGDANLDGKINIDDYGRIDGNVGQSGTVFGWSRGDFNYDGKINIDDYGIIDGNINRQGTPFSTAGSATSAVLQGVAAVPEPASLSAVALAAVGPLRRRRR